MCSVPFDLAALYSAVDARRRAESLSWTALSRQIGVATSTIRRFATAADAEAKGLPRSRLANIGRWLRSQESPLCRCSVLLGQCAVAGLVEPPVLA